MLSGVWTEFLLDRIWFKESENNGDFDAMRCNSFCCATASVKLFEKKFFSCRFAPGEELAAQWASSEDGSSAEERFCCAE